MRNAFLIANTTSRSPVTGGRAPVVPAITAERHSE